MSQLPPCEPSRHRSLVDTHCHLNIMVKETPDTPLTPAMLHDAKALAHEAASAGVTRLINVGTSLAESLNCIAIAQTIPSCYATVGIHPTDITDTWRAEFAQLAHLSKQAEHHKIVGIGETGFDKYHEGYNFNRQRDVFKAHIELALTHDLALVVHSREAADETLTVLDEYRRDIKRCTLHCFSYNESIAQTIVEWGWYIGIDAPITYPKNTTLRNVVRTTPLENIVLETDSPFLPPQELRGKRNHPRSVARIADFIAELLDVDQEVVDHQTTANACALFQLPPLN